jgi:hypothetical protein
MQVPFAPGMLSSGRTRTDGPLAVEEAGEDVTGRGQVGLQQRIRGEFVIGVRDNEVERQSGGKRTVLQ